MATRSTISRKMEDGTIRGIYCHWDGYRSHNGKILLAFYNTPEKIDELIALGSIYSLFNNVKPNENEPHTFDAPQQNVVIAYHRDRGEDLNIFTVHDKRFIVRQECNYHFEDGKWFYSHTENKQSVWVELLEEHCN